MSSLKDLVVENHQDDLSVTFLFNKDQPIFSWYPYTEGYSGRFVEKVLEESGVPNDSIVLDPYAGCGTTPLACTLQGIDSLSIEINPFMCFVAKTKNRLDIYNEDIYGKLYKVLKAAKRRKAHSEVKFFNDSKFFPRENLVQLLKLKDSILEMDFDDSVRDLFLLALSSITVAVSNMKRRADLRYRSGGNSPINVIDKFKEVALRYLDHLSRTEPKECTCEIVNDDIMNLKKIPEKYEGSIDLFVTSPPYLNGTNYIRNSKLELALLDFIETREDLVRYHKRLITGGINSVRKDPDMIRFPSVEELVERAEPVAYDTRIPRMLRGYFSDMYKSLMNIDRLLSDKAVGYTVIGDSRYMGVHIPTDLLFAQLCEEVGWNVESVSIARKRKSKDGSELRESVVKVRKC